MKAGWPVLLIALAAGGQTSSTHPSVLGVWRSQDRHIDWVYAPKDLGYKERGGVATIIRFSPDHTFTLVYDTIIQESGHEVASVGDSQSIFYGTWREYKGQILVSYGAAYIDIPSVKDGRMVCDPPVTDQPITFEHSYVVFSGEKLKQSLKLKESVDRLFRVPANFHADPKSCGNYANGAPYPPPTQ